MSPADRRPRLLLVDDDRTFRRTTAELLREDGYEVETAEDSATGGRKLAAGTFDLLLLDLRMPGLDGSDFVEILRRRGDRIPILMISGYGTVQSAVDVLHLGADDFLTKPVDPEDLSRRVARLLRRRPSEELLEAGRFSGIVGSSRAMRAVFAAIRQVADSDTTVLVTGESGTGKELVARALHNHSARAGEGFVPVNCSALAEGILESELFGHRRGAFTGAHTDREGLFRSADGGTLFLDEVGDMGLRLQQRLLRVLQEREVVPVGDSSPVSVDVRVIAATHRDLTEEVEADRFRSDLFYRLDVFRIQIPPLRERASDIPLLVEEALTRLRRRSRKPVPSACSPLAMRLLQSHPWPGNVRQLFGVIESAAIRAGEDRIDAHHLPDDVRQPETGERALRYGHEARRTTENRSGSGRYRAPDNAEDERAAIRAALERTGGVRTEAARLLGMSRSTLWRKMKEYGQEDGDDL